MINPINIPCSVHFDVRLFSCDAPLDPAAGRKLELVLKATRNFFSVDPRTICADPFLFSDGKKLFLFYEEMQKIYTNGKIRMISTADLVNWSAPVTVLESQYHLSYPFVFEAEGAVWMIPECWRSGGVELFRAVDGTLEHWASAGKLVSGEKLVDSSVFFKDGRWYMHTCSFEGKERLLRLYTADKLTGPWSEHVCSPVAASRNGGAIHAENGRLFRFAQREDVYYGDGLDLFEITELSPQGYREKPVREHFMNHCHHCSIARFDGKTLMACTHAFLSFMPCEFLRRLRHAGAALAGKIVGR